MAWEYRIEKIGMATDGAVRRSVEALNKLGAEGWAIAGVSGDSSRGAVVLQREVTQPDITAWTAAGWRQAEDGSWIEPGHGS